MSESDASGTMRIAYLDCFSGISGDMFMGALLDAGVSPKLLEDAVAALNLGARLEIAKVTKGGLAATKADVWVAGEKDKPRDEYWAEHEQCLSIVMNTSMGICTNTRMIHADGGARATKGTVIRTNMSQ